MKCKTLLQVIFSITFGIFFIYLFVNNTNWQAIFETVKHTKLHYIFFAIGSVLICFFFRLLRWFYMLRQYNKGINITTCFSPYFFSFALNNILPLRLGDVARAMLFTQHLGISPHAVVSSLVLERMLDLLSLIIILFVSLHALGISPSSHLVVFYVYNISTIVLALITFFIFFPSVIKKIILQVHNVSDRQNLPALKKISQFITLSTEKFYLHINLKSFLFLFFLSFSAWSFEALMYFFVSMSLDIQVSSIQNFLVMTLSTFSALLPSTPGYVGTFHYFCKVALGFVGVPNVQAIAASLLIHAGLIIPVTIIGFSAFFIHFGKNWNQKIRESFEKRVNE